jgi:hypothetical protein
MHAPVHTVRSYKSPRLCVQLQEMQYIEQETPVRFRIKEGMVPGMRVPGKFYVNDRLKSLIFDELHAATQRGGQGGFSPAIKQIANVAALPGIVRVSYCILTSRVGAPGLAACAMSTTAKPQLRAANESPDP